MFYSTYNNRIFCAQHANLLPGEQLPHMPQTEEAIYLFAAKNMLYGRDAFAVSHPGQLYAPAEDANWLNDSFLTQYRQDTDPALLHLIEQGSLRAVKHNCHRFEELIGVPGALPPMQKKYRLNLIAIGDVGSTLLMGLRLMGGDAVESIGIYDLSEQALTRFEFEINQIHTIGLEHPLPEVHIIRSEEALFDCDMLIFCATKGVPPLTQMGDVRLAQYKGNRELVTLYAKKARQHRFRGLFAVVSDPVDLLCKAAWLESNTAEDGTWDGSGLHTEQVEGYGLGVMYARAAYYARRDERFASFLTEGAAYGPHGEDLVIANSLQHYDDALSVELTHLTATANLKARENGFKPYIAPALSSAAFNILNTLRGKPHHSTTMLGDVFFGAVSQRTRAGICLHTAALPDALCKRLSATEQKLRQLA